MYRYVTTLDEFTRPSLASVLQKAWVQGNTEGTQYGLAHPTFGDIKSRGLDLPWTQWPGSAPCHWGLHSTERPAANGKKKTTNVT